MESLKSYERFRPERALRAGGGAIPSPGRRGAPSRILKQKVLRALPRDTKILIEVT
jgi:hypothetical protein